MTNIRINKTTEIITDDFTVDDASKTNRVLAFRDEHDPANDLIYIFIGTKQLGWIPKRDLRELAQMILKEFELLEGLKQK